MHAVIVTLANTRVLLEHRHRHHAIIVLLESMWSQWAVLRRLYALHVQRGNILK